MGTIAGGIWAAALTPLNPDLSIDLGAYRDHVRWLLSHGCNGVAALGTTGEANSFSVAERQRVIRALGDANHTSERIIVGVGCCAAPDTIALCRAALDAGFTNVLMLPPFYYKGVSEDGLFRAYAHVIETLNEPSLRVIIYDIPQQTGLKMSLDFLAKLKAAFDGVVVGVKNSAGDWNAIDSACSRLPNFNVFAGTEQFLLPTLRAGGKGCISASANVTCAKLARLAKDWHTDRADMMQADVTDVRLRLQQFPMIPALKEIMARATGRDGWRRLRPPLENLSAEDAQNVSAQFFEDGALREAAG